MVLKLIDTVDEIKKKVKEDGIYVSENFLDENENESLKNNILENWYSKTENLFSPGQLAIISIVTGTLVTAILSVTMFNYNYTMENKITNGFGFVLVMIGAILLLYDKEFNYV